MMNQNTITQLSRTLLLLGIILLAACGSETQSLAKAFSQSEPGCDLPCWNGMKPGETSEADFLVLIEDIQKTSTFDLDRFEVDAQTIQYRWFDPTLERMIRALFGDDRLQWIEIDGYPNSLREIIDELGPPDTYQALIAGGEQDMLSLLTFYEGQGVFIDMFTVPYKIPSTASSPICSIEVEEEIKVASIYIVQQDESEKMLETVWPLPSHPIMPWTGFGTIDLSECY